MTARASRSSLERARPIDRSCAAPVRFPRREAGCGAPPLIAKHRSLRAPSARVIVVTETMQRALSTIAVLFVLGCNGQPATTRPVAAAPAPSTPPATKRPESASATPSSPPTPPPPRGVAGKYTIDTEASVRALGPGPGPANPKGQAYFGLLRATMQQTQGDLELRADGGYTMNLSLDVDKGESFRGSERGVWTLAGALLTLTRSGEAYMTCRVVASTLECRDRPDQPAGIFRRAD